VNCLPGKIVTVSGCKVNERAFRGFTVTITSSDFTHPAGLVTWSV